MRSILTSGLRLGGGLGASLVLLWLLVVAITDKEPPEVRQAFRIQAPARTSSSGVVFDPRTCSHCPEFMLFERGFGLDGVFAPLVLLSAPAVLVSRDFGTYWIPEVRPIPFAIILLLEGLILGIVATAVRAAFRRTRDSARTSASA